MNVSEVKQILKDNKMQDMETNFKVYKNGGGKITVAELYDEFKDFKQVVLSFIAEQRKFNEQQNKNGEQQRKFNQYVLDVFQRNNLK